MMRLSCLFARGKLISIQQMPAESWFLLSRPVAGHTGPVRTQAFQGRPVLLPAGEQTASDYLLLDIHIS